MTDLETLESEVKAFGTAILEVRWVRLQKRKFVLFPFLRAKWLLRKIRILKG